MEHDMGKLVEYLCLGCGSQGLILVGAEDLRVEGGSLARGEFSCPGCGGPASAYDFRLNPAARSASSLLS